MISGTPPTSSSPTGSAAKPGPWSPKAIAVISFFFSFLPAGIMYSINYERLGEPKKKLWGILITVVLFLAFAVAVVATPDTGPAPHFFRVFHLAVAFFFLRSPQAPLFKEYLAKGGQPGKLRNPILASVGFVVLLLGGAVAYVWVDTSQQQERYDAGFEMINKGDFAGAEALFMRARDEAPDDVDPYWGLANIYLRMERFDEARAQVDKALALEPDLEEAKQLREALETEAANAADEKVSGAP